MSDLEQHIYPAFPAMWYEASTAIKNEATASPSLNRRRKLIANKAINDTPPPPTEEGEQL
jgi:hypothetical protein